MVFGRSLSLSLFFILKVTLRFKLKIITLKIKLKVSWQFPIFFSSHKATNMAASYCYLLIQLCNGNRGPWGLA